MRALAALAIVILPALAFAQVPPPPDIVARPTASIYSPGLYDPSNQPNVVEACLVTCGVDHLDPANHQECQPLSLGGFTTHTVIVPHGLGSVCLRGVLINDEGVVSEPSPNKVDVQDVPLPPVVTPEQ